MCKSYNHKVIPKAFKVGDLILKENPNNQQDREKGNFEPNWSGPFVIIVAYGLEAYQLSTSKGDVLDEPTNSIHLKKFYTQVIECMDQAKKKEKKLNKKAIKIVTMVKTWQTGAL